MKEHRETIDALIRESNKLKEMIREDQSWYQVKQSCNVIFDSIDAGISIVDKDGIYTFINKVAAGRLLLSPDQVTGKNISEVLDENEAKFYVEEILKPVLSDGREVKSGKSVRLVEKTCLLDYRCLPVRNESGNITGILNISFDVTLEEKRKKYFLIQENINNTGFQTETMEDTIKGIFDLLCQIDCIKSGGIYIFDESRQLLELIKKQYPSTEVIMITGFGEMDTVIRSMRLGAIDFFTKPFLLKDLDRAIQKTKAYIHFQREMMSGNNGLSLCTEELQQLIGHPIIGESRQMKEVIKFMHSITDSIKIFLCGKFLYTGWSWF